MNKVVETLKQHIQKDPPNLGDADSLLDMLFWHHLDYNQFDNEKVKTQFVELRNMLNLSPLEYDKVFYVVGDLCLEHARLAFCEGIKVGIALQQELD